MNDLQASFDEWSSEYDFAVEKVCPFYDDALNALICLIPDNAKFVLELGCGTGNLTKRILDTYPDVHVTAVDLSEKMIIKAKEKVSMYSRRVTFVQKEIEAFTSPYTYDACVSSLAIHHLDSKHKQLFFDAAYSLLETRGVLYLFDHTLGASQSLEEINHTAWLMYMRKKGGSEAEIQEIQKRRAAHDICEAIIPQLMMMKRSGFVDIDVVWKYYGLAVFGGRKY